MKILVSNEALRRHARGLNVNKKEIALYREKLAPLEGTWVKVEKFVKQSFIVKSAGVPVHASLVDDVDFEKLENFENMKAMNGASFTENELYALENLMVRIGKIEHPSLVRREKNVIS